MSEKALYPDYFDSFYCIADECKNTCCGGWNINIDKKTLKKYKNSNHPLIKEKRKNLFNSGPRGTFINLDENRMCPLLDNKNLCSIHKELGVDFLSDTCKIYPRVLKKIDGTLELSLSASCEAAAKLILENKDGISFISGMKENYYTQLKNQDTSSGTLIRRKFWAIRVFIIELLQCRDLLVEERLSIIGLFINKLQSATTEEKVEELIEYYTKQAYDGTFNGMINSLENYNQLLRIQTEVLNSIQLELFRTKAYKHLASGLNDNLFSGNFNIDQYIEVHESAYREFISDKQYIIENYLVNVFFNTPTVFNDFESLNNSYIAIIIRAGLVKNITTNALILNSDLTVDELFFMISKLSRILDHSEKVNKLIEDVLKNNIFNSTSKLLALAV